MQFGVITSCSCLGEDQGVKTTGTSTSDVRGISACGPLKRDALVTNLEISLKAALSERDRAVAVAAETHGKLDRYMSMHARDRADRLQRHSLSRNEAVQLEQIDANGNGEIYYCTDDDSDYDPASLLDARPASPLVTEHLVAASKEQGYPQVQQCRPFSVQAQADACNNATKRRDGKDGNNAWLSDTHYNHARTSDDARPLNTSNSVVGGANSRFEVWRQRYGGVARSECRSPSTESDLVFANNQSNLMKLKENRNVPDSRLGFKVSS